MVNTNPREPGDDIYEQYTIKKTYQLATGVTAIKGNLYTFNTSGTLINLVNSSGTVALNAGVVQATADVAPVSYTSGDGPTVQCHVAGSWVILKSAGDIPVQSRVIVDVDTVATPNVPRPQYVDSLGTTTAIAYALGTIHEVLTLGSGETVKTLAAEDDLVVVQMGVSA